MKLKWQPIVFLVLLVLNMIGVFHELAHAFTALAFGYKVYGIYIGVPYSYTELSGANAVVLASGGLVQAGIFAVMVWAIFKFESLRTAFGRSIIILLVLMVVYIAYAISEVITGT